MSKSESPSSELPASNLRLKGERKREQVSAPPPKLKKVQKTKKPGKTASRFGLRFLGMSIGSFIFGSLIFGAFLYHQVNDLEILTSHQATMTRNIVVLAFYVILIIEAFTEDMLQGVISIFLPLYPFVYGLLFADAGPIRGLTLAMILFLGAEVHFTPDNSLAIITADTVNGWIETGQQKLIDPDRPEAGFEK